MTKREREIIKILKENPLISQNELAESLGISRSSAAVHITNLMKKGIIIGKGYVIKDEKYVAVMGGANVDINGFPNDKLVERDSNPGKVEKTLGGVGRNIAENLAKLGVSTRLLTLVGNDDYGTWLLDKTKLEGVDVNLVKKLSNYNTGTYLTIQDEDGNMLAAINQMDIFEEMDERYPQEVLNILKSAETVVIDTNLSQKAIDYIFSKIGNTRVVCDTVSVAKAMRIKEHLGKLFLLKPNSYEAEELTGIKFKNDIATLKEIGKSFMDKGLENLILSMGKKGVYCRNNKVEGIITHDEVHTVNANGAGDALIAAVAKESSESNNLIDWAVRGVAAAIISIQSELTTPEELTDELIDETIKEFNIQWKNI